MKKSILLLALLVSMFAGAVAATRYPLFSWNSAGYSFKNGTYTVQVGNGTAAMTGSAVTASYGPAHLHYEDGASTVDLTDNTTTASKISTGNTLDLAPTALQIMETPVVTVTIIDGAGNTHNVYGID